MPNRLSFAIASNCGSQVGGILGDWPQLFYVGQFRFGTFLTCTCNQVTRPGIRLSSLAYWSVSVFEALISRPLSPDINRGAQHYLQNIDKQDDHMMYFHSLSHRWRHSSVFDLGDLGHDLLLHLLRLQLLVREEGYAQLKNQMILSL